MWHQTRRESNGNPARAGIRLDLSEVRRYWTEKPRTGGGLPSIPILPRVQESAAPQRRGPAFNGTELMFNIDGRPEWTGGTVFAPLSQVSRTAGSARAEICPHHPAHAA